MSNSDYTKNLSVEYYNYRNWHYDNQTRDKNVEHGILVPYRYLINMNIIMCITTLTIVTFPAPPPL